MGMKPCTCRVPRLRGFRAFAVCVRSHNQQLARLQCSEEFDSHPRLQNPDNRFLSSNIRHTDN